MRKVVAFVLPLAAIAVLLGSAHSLEPLSPAAPIEPEPEEPVQFQPLRPGVVSSGDAFIEFEPAARASFPRLNEDGARVATRDGSFDLSFAARTPLVPSLQIGVTQRTRVDEDDDSIRFLGREYRLGDLGIGEYEQRSWDNPQWYFFVANDDGALTYNPSTSDGYRVRIDEDRLTVGDLQAGISVEAAGVQASLSYMQREASGANGASEDASFTGFSITYRR